MKLLLGRRAALDRRDVRLTPRDPASSSAASASLFHLRVDRLPPTMHRRECTRRAAPRRITPSPYADRKLETFGTYSDSSDPRRCRGGTGTSPPGGLITRP